LYIYEEQGWITTPKIMQHGISLKGLGLNYELISLTNQNNKIFPK